MKKSRISVWGGKITRRGKQEIHTNIRFDELLETDEVVDCKVMLK